MNEYMMERNLKEVPSVVPQPETQAERTETQAEHPETQTNLDTPQSQVAAH